MYLLDYRMSLGSTAFRFSMNLTLLTLDKMRVHACVIFGECFAAVMFRSVYNSDLKSTLRHSSSISQLLQESMCTSYRKLFRSMTVCYRFRFAYSVSFPFGTKYKWLKNDTLLFVTFFALN